MKIGDFQSQVCVCAASANLICAEKLRGNEVKNERQRNRSVRIPDGRV